MLLKRHEKTGLLQGEERVELVKELHRVKTDIFMQMVESKQLPLRPGVKRLVLEAHMAGQCLVVWFT